MDIWARGGHLERTVAHSGESTEAAVAQRRFGPFRTTDGRRLRCLDLARGLAIIFMVLQHVQIVFVVGYGESSACTWL